MINAPVANEPNPPAAVTVQVIDGGTPEVSATESLTSEQPPTQRRLPMIAAARTRNPKLLLLRRTTRIAIQTAIRGDAIANNMNASRGRNVGGTARLGLTRTSSATAGGSDLRCGVEC
jgi:hypothetical protein